MPEFDLRTPGAGLITPGQFNDWLKVLSLLPESVAKDPSAQFCNPNLVTPLLEQLQAVSRSQGGGRINVATYEALKCTEVTPEKVDVFLQSSVKLLTTHDKHYYHNLFHSVIEVPARLNVLLRHLLPDALPQSAHRELLRAAAPVHDLLHLGTNYAQRMTPGINISNEERAVTAMAEHALKAGFSPIQVLELQRIILPTSFRQKEAHLNMTASSASRMNYLNGPAYNLERIDGEFWGDKDLSKELLVRSYDPDAAEDSSTKGMARILALADVLVTIGSFENFLARTQVFFLETKVGQGMLPSDSYEFMVQQAGFIEDFVRPRLEACSDLLDEKILHQQRLRIDRFVNRLRNPDEHDKILIERIIDEYSHNMLRLFPDISGILE